MCYPWFPLWLCHLIPLLLCVTLLTLSSYYPDFTTKWLLGPYAFLPLWLPFWLCQLITMCYSCSSVPCDYLFDSVITLINSLVTWLPYHLVTLLCASAILLLPCYQVIHSINMLPIWSWFPMHFVNINHTKGLPFDPRSKKILLNML